MAMFNVQARDCGVVLKVMMLSQSTPLKPPYQFALSTHPINTPYQHSLPIHPLDPHPETLNPHSLSFLSFHFLIHPPSYPPTFFVHPLSFSTHPPTTSTHLLFPPTHPPTHHLEVMLSRPPVAGQSVSGSGSVRSLIGWVQYTLPPQP